VARETGKVEKEDAEDNAEAQRTQRKRKRSRRGTQDPGTQSVPGATVWLRSSLLIAGGVDGDFGYCDWSQA